MYDFLTLLSVHSEILTLSIDGMKGVLHESSI
jgi:hypothetical protein